MLEVIIDCGPAWGEEPDQWQQLTEKAAAAAISCTPHGEILTRPATYELSVKLADDAEVQLLNATYRDKDKPTNVLSFPMLSPDFDEQEDLADDGEILLGDLILAQETCAREAAEKGIGITDHFSHLIAHGTLHLLGYDHELGEVEAEEMEEMERLALASLGIADPYRED